MKTSSSGVGNGARDGGEENSETIFLNIVKNDEKGRLGVVLDLRLGEGVCILGFAICEELT